MSNAGRGYAQWDGPQSVSPDPEAVQMAEWMAGQQHVMRDVLHETIDSGEHGEIAESGRTICGQGGTPHGPLARFPESVELRTCPFGITGGTYHTHVTLDELRTPQNSLPDTSNVIFGDVDVSGVVGTRSVEFIVAPDDHDAAIAEFQDAIGVEVESHTELVDAIIDGRVSPSTARRRVRNRMTPLFLVYRTDFNGLDDRVERLRGYGVDETIHGMTMEMRDARMHSEFYTRMGVPSWSGGIDPNDRVRGQADHAFALVRSIFDRIFGGEFPPFDGEGDPPFDEGTRR